MSQAAVPGRAIGRERILWVALAGSASALVFWLVMATGGHDMEASESPLVLAAARQLSHPGALYGPYEAGHRLVLIHAPVYYRLTALFAWPLARFWGDPVAATLVAGRVLSGLGLLGILAGLYRLARLDGAGRSTGVVAALFFAAAPIQGGLAFEVRPDMLGSALVFLGLSLALERPARGMDGRGGLLAGFAILGLAVCVKQQNVIVLIAAAVGYAARAPAVWRQAAAGLTVAVGVAAVILGVEQWISGGLMARSIMIAAGRVSRVHPASWGAAGNMLLALVWKNTGPILIVLAIVLAIDRASARRLVRVAGIMGCAVVVLLAGVAWLQAAQPRPGQGGLLAFGLVLLSVLVFPGVRWLDQGRLRGGGLDRLVFGLLCCELALVAVLARLSTGAWYNYAITAEGLACVLAGRLASRVLSSPAWSRAKGGLTLLAAGSAAVVCALTDVREVAARRTLERWAAGRVVEIVGNRPSSIYFVDRPGDNRVFGNRELVFDPWLYPVFEELGWAEPRAAWLGEALERGPVEMVATAGDQPAIPGLVRDLPGMGYRPTERVGFFRVWRRERTARLRSTQSPNAPCMSVLDRGGSGPWSLGVAAGELWPGSWPGACDFGSRE